MSPKRVRGFAWCLAVAFAAGAAAAPVVVTPGPLAAYIFVPPAGSGSGNGTSSGPVETLQRCFVSPTSGMRTLVMSTRNWTGWTKPVTVYYKLVGGGASAGWGTPAQFASAGGSSVIMKNGTIVSAAFGMSASQMAAGRQVQSGSFTVTSTDTLVFVAGGGAGAASSGWVSYDYSGYYYYYYPGGGGAGYYGGGAGQAYGGYGYPAAGAYVATGGTSTAGGTGAASGGYYYGASNVSGGGSNASNGGNATAGLYSGGKMMAGGGGGLGRSGNSGGQSNSWMGMDCPIPSDEDAAVPTATTFDLSQSAGKPGKTFSGTDPYGYYYSCVSGGGFGQIVLQYQAPTCDLIPQFSNP